MRGTEKESETAATAGSSRAKQQQTSSDDGDAAAAAAEAIGTAARARRVGRMVASSGLRKPQRAKRSTPALAHDPVQLRRVCRLSSGRHRRRRRRDRRRRRHRCQHCRPSVVYCIKSPREAHAARERSDALVAPLATFFAIDTLPVASRVRSERVVEAQSRRGCSPSRALVQA